MRPVPLLFITAILVLSGFAVLFQPHVVPKTADPVLRPGGEIDHQVEVISGAFSPENLTITIGDTVTWVNMDLVARAVSDSRRALFDSADLAGGENFSHEFLKAGTFEVVLVGDGVLGNITVEEGVDVLLVGNSYTFYNNLDSIVEGLLQVGGRDPHTDRLSGGGMTLPDHVNRAQTSGDGWENLLVTGSIDWDWVILQDQSQIPGFDQGSGTYQQSLAAVRTLNGMIEDKDGETLFLMTWGRRNGDSQNPSRFPDFSTMQGHLESGYLNYASDVSTPERPAWVAPVGLAFQHIHDRIIDSGSSPTAAGSDFHRLYNSDGSHPSLEGSYLAASVLYAVITGDSPVGLLDGASIAPDVKIMLQESAAATVFNETSHILYPHTWDQDGDGVVNGIEECPNGTRGWVSNQATDRDGAGCRDDGEDLDDDGDGIGDVLDACDPGEMNWSGDHDLDGCRDDGEDLDDDNDGILDTADGCPRGDLNWIPDFSTDMDADGCRDATEDIDDDGDLVNDIDDNCPLLSNPDQLDTDSDGAGDLCDGDDDGDGASDAEDLCPLVFGTSQWPLGCVDNDGDGTADSDDLLPADPTQANDSDGDGFGDNATGTNGDPFPDDASQWRDTDGDGYGDNASGNDPDLFPSNPTQWSDRDGDGYGDNSSGTLADACPDRFGTAVDPAGCPDSDGDGVLDDDDAFPLNPAEWRDADGDGTGDNQDLLPELPLRAGVLFGAIAAVLALIGIVTLLLLRRRSSEPETP